MVALPGACAREKCKRIFPENSEKFSRNFLEKFSELKKISGPDFRILHRSGTGCPARAKKKYRQVKDS